MIYRRLLSAALVCVALFTAAGTANAEILSHANFPFRPFSVFNECTGEWVMLEGDVHLVLTEVVRDDGTIQRRQNGNARGWGVGEESGAVYVFNENFHFNRTITTGTAFSRSADIYTRLVGLGDTPNQRMIYTLTLDIDEDGNETMSMSEIIICQGD